MKYKFIIPVAVILVLMAAAIVYQGVQIRNLKNDYSSAYSEALSAVVSAATETAGLTETECVTEAETSQITEPVTEETVEVTAVTSETEVSVEKTTATETHEEPEDNYYIEEPEYHSIWFPGAGPMYVILCGASKSESEAFDFSQSVRENGFSSIVLTSSDWTNLNSETWYCTTAGTYSDESEAYRMLNIVHKVYPDAYVKYTGEYKPYMKAWN